MDESPTQMTLSPSAQAVLDAIGAPPHLELVARGIAAVALRTAADQVSPENYESFTGYAEYDQGLETRNDSVRESLLAIAAELEGQS